MLGSEAVGTEEWLKLERAIVDAETKVSQYERGLKQTETALNRLGTSGRKDISKLELATIQLANKMQVAADRMKKVGTALKNAGNSMKPISTAAAGAITAIGLLAVKAGQGADDLNTYAKTLGLSTESLQKFKFASERIDVSLETLGKSLKRSIANIGQISRGNEQLKSTYDKLGVSIYNVDGSLRNNEDVFNDTILALSNIANKTERGALATQLFGKSASDLNPLLEGGIEDLNAYSAEMEKLGLVVSQDKLDQANKLGDAFDRFKAILEQVALAVGASLAPIFTDFFQVLGNLVAEWGIKLSELDRTHQTLILAFLAIVAALAPLLIFLGQVSLGVSALTSLFTPLVTAIGAAGGIVPFLSGVLTTLSAKFSFLLGPVGLIIAIFIVLYTQFESVRDLFDFAIKQIVSYLQFLAREVVKMYKTYVEPTLMKMKASFDKLKVALEPIINFLAGILKTVLGVAFDVLKSVTKVALNVMGKSFEILGSVISATVDIITSIIKTLTTVISGIYKAIKPALDLVGPLIKAAFEGAINFVTDLFSGLASWIDDKISSIRSSIKGVTDFIGKINPFDSGGFGLDTGGFGVDSGGYGSLTVNVQMGVQTAKNISNFEAELFGIQIGKAASKYIARKVR